MAHLKVRPTKDRRGKGTASGRYTAFEVVMANLKVRPTKNGIAAKAPRAEGAVR